MQSVCELRAGDTIRVRSEHLVVTSEPMTVHRGLGLFDDFALLVAVEVRPHDDTGPRRRLLGSPETEVFVVRRPDGED